MLVRATGARPPCGLVRPVFGATELLDAIPCPLPVHNNVFKHEVNERCMKELRGVPCVGLLLIGGFAESTPVHRNRLHKYNNEHMRG